MGSGLELVWEDCETSGTRLDGRQRALRALPRLGSARTLCFVISSDISSLHDTPPAPLGWAEFLQTQATVISSSLHFFIFLQCFNYYIITLENN